MKNNNYIKPKFSGIIHQFEYDDKEYYVCINKKTGKFTFNILSKLYDENRELRDEVDLYFVSSDNYWELKDLFFTFHKLVVPHQIKVDAGYQDGTYEYPMNTGKLADMLNDLTGVE